ncbi:MAG: CDP-glycerol glycerophosphotransferase family protein [Lachnospiraceae bacterium]|nr:CDP-glycerol glycerophosphotransferase family protein [Lachnospiraceae bacterium]
MRKAQKRQVEETIRQMEEAHVELKRCIEMGIAAQAEELLADCQDAAVAIGTLIEDTEGEGHLAVTVLEEYCELVYQTHENLAADGINANKIYKILRQKLIKAENSIRNDIKIRTEVVFLPYKASMWDSLESVWKAADADPNCDAYVIPIPYFDKNPDGSFKEEHYEGDQYPDYVPITRYDEYDLGAEHPDVIYIHNPYDECNYVTSVHPHFYSKNLRNYTDKLVYIPYFVLGEIEPDNDGQIEGMKHFVTTPAVFHAHKVIVQSEDMKQVYIKVLLDATNDHSEAARQYWDNKILGTGSPKIDKVSNTRKEDLEIPQEWLKIIEKPDGSWKKIIFYNTSVGALLQHSEKMLAKMESVFEIFKENKDEVALLWRPHPLIQATIESMRPQLWEKYKEIKDMYIEEDWGIYDDTSDVDRAVLLSDAYYGDGSSVVQMYQQTGKSIMMQNVDVMA